MVTDVLARLLIGLVLSRYVHCGKGVKRVSEGAETTPLSAYRILADLVGRLM
jgi:hypothetical protein